MHSEYSPMRTRFHNNNTNIQRILSTCYKTFAEPSQTCNHIFHRISEALGPPFRVSEYFSCTKHTHSEYFVLFIRIMQTIYRIFKDLRKPSPSLPQHSNHTDTHLRTFVLRKNAHRNILRYSFAPINPVFLFALLKFSINVGSIAKHSQPFPPFSEYIGAFLPLADSSFIFIFILTTFAFL